MFKQIGTDFSLDGLIDFEELQNLPQVIRNYNDSYAGSFPTDKSCWLTYPTNGGSISFSRNTSNFYPAVARYTIEYMHKIVDVPLFVDRVHFVRTIGRVDPHRDEANRNCCINFGLRNSNSAITKVSPDPDPTKFEEMAQDFICEDGSVYLLNTQKIHSVVGTDLPRYMVTYGFQVPFDTVLKQVYKTL